MSTFTSCVHAGLTKYDGPLTTLLECDSNELLGTEWRRTIHPDDLGVALQSAADIQACRGGVYRLRNVSKSGDRYLVRIVTFGALALGIVRGTATIEDYELNRKHFPIQQSLTLKGLP